MDQISPEDRYRAPALDKGLDILELLASTEEGLTQAEIAKALGRTPNEFYRMLDRLVRRKYIARVGGDRYELTLKLFALAHQHAPVRRLVSQAMPLMRAFTQETHQAAHIAVYDRGEVIVVAQVEFAAVLGTGDPRWRARRPYQHRFRARAARLCLSEGARLHARRARAGTRRGRCPATSIAGSHRFGVAATRKWRACRCAAS